MANVRPFKAGDITGNQMLNAKEMSGDDLLFDPGHGPADPSGNRFMVRGAEGVVLDPDTDDETGPTSVKDIVRVDAQRDFIATPRVLTQRVVLESRAQLHNVGVRGFATQDDHPLRFTFPMMGASYSRSGRWRAGFQPGTFPDDVDSLWRTDFSGNHTSMTGTLVVGDTVQSASFVTSVSGWKGKLIALGATTWTVSLWEGTAGAEDIQKTGALGNFLTGVSITFGNGATTGYADKTGLKIIRRGNTGPIYNAITAQSSTLFTNPSAHPTLGGTLQPVCWPKFPGYMRSTLWAPPNIFVDGAQIAIDLSGWFTVTCPQGELPQMSVVLAIGQNIFAEPNLKGTGLISKQVEFATPVLPDTGATRIPVSISIRGYAMRHEDRTQVQLWVGQFKFPASYWGGSGVFETEIVRGTDSVLNTPGSNPVIVGHDFITAGQRISVRFAMVPFLPTTGLSQCEFRSITAYCGR